MGYEHQRRKARYLVVTLGVRQKEAAASVGVSERTLSTWAREGDWKQARIEHLRQENDKRIYLEDFEAIKEDNSDFKRKKIIVHYLIVVKGYTQKDAAHTAGVSEKSVCKWVREGKWKEERRNALAEAKKKNAFFSGFLGYVLTNSPRIYNQVQKLWEGYLKSLQNEFDTVLNHQGG